MANFSYSSYLSQKTFQHKRNALAFSILGLFAKVINIDLSKLQFYGIVLPPENTNLIPGFLGISLSYSMVMLAAYTAFDIKVRGVEKDQLINPETITDSVVLNFLPDYLRSDRNMSEDEIKFSMKLIREWAENGFTGKINFGDIDLIREYGLAKRKLLFF